MLTTYSSRLLARTALEAEVAKINDLRQDPHAARMAEHQVWQTVLQAIAEGTSDPQDIAKIALTTLEIPFLRND